MAKTKTSKNGKSSKTKKVIDLPVSLPTKWGELSSAQVNEVARLMSLELERSDFLLRVALYFSGLKPHGSKVEADGSILYAYYDRNVGNILLTAEQLNAIAEAVAWLLGAPTLMSPPMVDDYKLPNKQLFGCTLEQFIVADSAYSAYHKLSSPDALRLMTAALYIRGEKFDDAKLAAEADRLKYIPLWNLAAVALWFTGVKSWIADKYSYVFSTSSEGEQSPVNGVDTLLNLMSSLNEGRIVDNEKIKKVELHEALHELNLKIRASQDAKSR